MKNAATKTSHLTIVRGFHGEVAEYSVFRYTGIPNRIDPFGLGLPVPNAKGETRAYRRRSTAMSIAREIAAVTGERIRF